MVTFTNKCDKNYCYCFSNTDYWLYLKVFVCVSWEDETGTITQTDRLCETDGLEVLRVARGPRYAHHLEMRKLEMY